MVAPPENRGWEGSPPGPLLPCSLIVAWPLGFTLPDLPSRHLGNVFSLKVVAPESSCGKQTANPEQSVRVPVTVSLVESLGGSGRWTVRARPSGWFSCLWVSHGAGSLTSLPPWDNFTLWTPPPCTPRGALCSSFLV